MTATTRLTHRHVRRRPLRIASMEALGFTDRPGAATTWTTTTRVPVPTPVVSTGPATATETLADRRPSDVGTRLLEGRVRWGATIVTLFIIVGLAGAAYWIYRQPQRTAEAAAADVINEATNLQTHLDLLADINATLTAETLEGSSPTSELMAIDSQARALFDASGRLASSETQTRSLATDAAGDILDASRLLGGAHAYRAAVVPVLAMPSFETDPALIQLDEAALLFGEWHLRLDRVRTALPDRVLSEVSAELATISGELEGVLPRYLDALRNDDRSAAVSVLGGLATRVTEAETLLRSSLADVQARVTDRLTTAATSLDLLVR